MSQRIDNRTKRREPNERIATFTAFGLAAEAKPLTPGLYVVATPIGNLQDVSFRALNVLAAADAVLAEDTRVTKTLLAHYGITTPLVAYHEHSNDAVRERMVHRIREGQALALVSDAGTPLVSDPGYKLVQAAIEEGLPVTPIPGPSAVLTALVASGLPTDRFLFAGFLPNKSSARRAAAGELKGVPATLVFFESPQRLPESLADLADILGAREAAVARELTKLYEEVRRGTLPELAAHYAEAGPPKGEVVLVIGPPGEEATPSEADVDALLREALTRLSVRDAAADVAARTGQNKRTVYARALELAREGKP